MSGKRRPMRKRTPPRRRIEPPSVPVRVADADPLAQAKPQDKPAPDPAEEAVQRMVQAAYT